MDRNATNNLILFSPQQPSDFARKSIESSISIPEVAGLLRGKKEKKAKYQAQWFLKNRERELQRNRDWYKNNKEKVKKYNHLYRIKNKDRLLKLEKIYRETHKSQRQLNRKQYYDKNKEAELLNNREFRRIHPEKQRIYSRNKIKEDIQFKLASRLRTRTRGIIKNNTIRGSAIKDLGCTVAELKIYLEKQFKNGMSWDNWTRIDLHKKAWNIDHIIPLANFDLTDSLQFKKAVHYTNLQPLWAIDNLSKSNKI